MRRLLLLALLLLVLGGVRCAADVTTPPVLPTATDTPSPSPYVTPTFPPTGTTTPSATRSTATMSPTPSPSTTPTATPLPTNTPLPTPTYTPLPAWLNTSSQIKAMAPRGSAYLDYVPNAPFYLVDAAVDLFGQEPVVAGTERVAYLNAENVPLSELYFRLYPNASAYNARMTIGRVAVNGKSQAPQFQVENSVLRVSLDKPLQPGERAIIEIGFVTYFKRNNQKHYRLLNYASNVVVMNNFFPMLAVYDQRGWNIGPIAEQGDSVYSDVALFQMVLTVPPEMVVVTTGSEIQKHENADKTMSWTFVSGPARDFGVIMSPDFKMAETTLGETRIRSFYLPKDERGGKAILTYARDALRVYQERFGEPGLYPYAEFDVVEAPVGAGGVEFPGMIFIKDEHYTLAEGYAEYVAAHEVAHQWWYGLVSNDQQAEPWVDEALANYTALLYYQAIHPGARAEEAFRWYFNDPYQQAVLDKRDTPVNLPASVYGNPTYYQIVYAKGALFYHALRQQLGDDRFFAIVVELLRQYRYGIISSQDLLDFWRGKAQQDINPQIERWILGPRR